MCSIGKNWSHPISHWVHRIIQNFPLGNQLRLFFGFLSLIGLFSTSTTEKVMISLLSKITKIAVDEFGPYIFTVDISWPQQKAFRF